MVVSQQAVLQSFHDELGHWGVRKTQRLVYDQFWWPKVLGEMACYVKSCSSCQRTKVIVSYRSWMFISQSSLFNVFFMEFAGLLPVTGGKKRFLLVCGAFNGVANSEGDGEGER